MFMALTNNPSLNEKLSVIIALAPAVYIGPLLNRFPVKLLRDCPKDLYKTIFGIKAFIPIMSVVQVLTCFCYFNFSSIHQHDF